MSGIHPPGPDGPLRKHKLDVPNYLQTEYTTFRTEIARKTTKILEKL